jgi:phosphatidylethanolamine/phosphatidyl-N-methylethanolamine N-methyltransferase
VTCRADETYTFFRAWLRDPLRVAAVLPSGRALASAITAEISSDTGPVIELGPGMGSFTRALIERGVPPERLALVEFNSDFAVKLQHLFPGSRILWMDASRLRDIELFGGEPAGAVVSGLPLLAMPARKVIAILDAAFAHLRADGAFYQFTYGPSCPVPRPLLDRLGLKATRIGRALANVPPAAVYRIGQRAPRPLRPRRSREQRAVAGATGRAAVIGSGGQS